MNSKPLRIYLSGSIKKGARDQRSDDHFWTQHDEDYIRGNLDFEIELLNPAKTDISRQDFGLNFGCDLHLVSISDVVLVDARTEKGIGIGAEMMFAVQRQIPVITWAPLNSHYRRSEVPDVFGENLKNWTHPFVFGLSDYVVESLAEAIRLIASTRSGEQLARHTNPESLIARYVQSVPDARFVAIGGGVYQDTRGGGNETEEICGATRYRFMDVLYLPGPTDEIAPEALLAVNRWRERRIAERPLLHCERIRRVAGAVIRSLGDERRIFEIGCGKFPFADDLPLTVWAGLDLDIEAVTHGVKRGYRIVQRPSEVTISDLQIDAILSLFTMQFAISDETLHLLERIPKDAIVLVNLPTRDSALAERRLSEISGLGFFVSILDLEATGVHDRFVLAGKTGTENLLTTAQTAALAQARIEWPSVGATFRWEDTIDSIAHRRNMR